MKDDEETIRPVLGSSFALWDILIQPGVTEVSQRETKGFLRMKLNGFYLIGQWLE